MGKRNRENGDWKRELRNSADRLRLKLVTKRIQALPARKPLVDGNNGRVSIGNGSLPKKVNMKRGNFDRSASSVTRLDALPSSSACRLHHFVLENVSSITGTRKNEKLQKELVDVRIGFLKFFLSF